MKNPLESAGNPVLRGAWILVATRRAFQVEDAGCRIPGCRLCWTAAADDRL